MCNKMIMANTQYLLHTKKSHKGFVQMTPFHPRCNPMREVPSLFPLTVGEADWLAQGLTSK